MKSAVELRPEAKPWGDRLLVNTPWIFLGFVLRAFHKIQVRGMENFTGSGPTLAIANHRRDSDGPIIGNILLGPRQRRREVPHIVAREDMFRYGFLQDYLDEWPGFSRKLLGLLNVGPLLEKMHTHPMRRIPERTVGEVLEDVYRIFGDIPLQEVLKPGTVERFEAMAPQRPVYLQQVLAARFRALLQERHGYRKMTRTYFVALKEHQRKVINRQLQTFVEVLERGDTVQLKPEGAIPADGRFAPIRAGLHELLRRCRVNVNVLPIGISYDFMTCDRRPQVFVSLGPELKDLQGLKRQALNQRAREAILAQWTVTATHLTGQFLWERAQSRSVFEQRDLETHMMFQARRYADLGARVDPRLLSAEGRSHCLDNCLTYLMRHALVSREGADCYKLQPFAVHSANYLDPNGVIQYANNELASLNTLFDKDHGSTRQ